MSYSSDLEHTAIEQSYALGLAYCHARRFADAEEALLATIRLAPDHAAAWQDLGGVYYCTTRYDEAEAAFRKALKHNPQAAQAHFSLACLLLRREAWSEAWPEFEWRKQCSSSIPRRPLGLPLWDRGQEVGQRILVANEDGFGDTFQFMRFVEPLARRGAELYFWSTDEQKALFQHLPFFRQVATYTQELPPAEFFSAYVTPLSLPYLLKVDQHSFPVAPYLRFDRQKAEGYFHRLGPRRERLRLGLIWASNRDVSPEALRWRSLQYRDLAPLLAEQDIRWISLQHGAVRGTLQGQERVEDWGRELQSFDDTAALFAALDGLVSVDTGPTHLAGALGVQSLCLLHRSACWRWGIHAERSTWYPSMQLVWQHDDEEWSGSMEQARLAIAAWQPKPLCEGAVSLFA